MQRDLKIGLALGLGLVVVAVVWVSTRPSMSPEARMPQLYDANSVEQAGPTKDTNEMSIVSVMTRSPEPNLPPAFPEAAPQETPVEKAAVPVVAEEKEPEPVVFDSTVHEQTEKIETQKFHIVRKGETLSKIAQTYYGSAGQWRKIFEANRQIISNPDKLTLGQKLIIPD